MQKFKILTTSRLAVFIGGAVLALLVAWPFVGIAQDKTDKAEDPDPHVQHKDKQPPGEQNLASQIADLHAKVAKLEAALAKVAPPVAAAPAGRAMPGMPGAAPASPAMGMGMDKMKPGGGMPGISAGGSPAPAMAGMGGSGAPAGGAMNMMGMMDKMMSMMEKMMGMGSGEMPAGAPMGGGSMAMMKDEMGGSGGGMMDMDMMEMMGMMGMAPKSAGGMAGMKSMGKMQMQAALPSFPGASHIYHIGATDFFLNHPEHITLTPKQKGELGRLKERAVLAKTSAQRKIDEAEQELWTLTADEEPDAAKIEAKIQEIEKMRGAQRMALIRAVGDAAKLLNDEQRQALLGTGANKADKTAKPDPHADHKKP